MIIKFCGARGVGKSTIAQKLADKCKEVTPHMVEVHDGIFRDIINIINSPILNGAQINTLEVWGCGLLIDKYIQAVREEKITEKYRIFSRSLLDLTAYWPESAILDDIISDIYRSNPIDLLVNVRVDVPECGVRVGEIGERRGYSAKEFVKYVKRENETIATTVAMPRYDFAYKKLLVVKNDMTEECLEDIVKTIYRMI